MWDFHGVGKKGYERLKTIQNGLKLQLSVSDLSQQPYLLPQFLAWAFFEFLFWCERTLERLHAYPFGIKSNVFHIIETILLCFSYFISVFIFFFSFLFFIFLFLSFIFFPFSLSFFFFLFFFHFSFLFSFTLAFLNYSIDSERGL